jgi:hypothetical protein
MPLIRFERATLVNHKIGSPKLYNAGELVYVSLDQLWECKSMGAKVVVDGGTMGKTPPAAPGESPFGAVVLERGNVQSRNVSTAAEPPPVRVAGEPLVG